MEVTMIFAWLLFFMSFLNIEIKSKCANVQAIRKFLLDKNARFVGVDEQTDTYFNTINGRLKLREGNIENNLIYYERSNLPGPKSSHFQLVKVNDRSEEHTSELQSLAYLVCRLLLEKKNIKKK